MPARSIPRRPSPVGMADAAASVVTGELGSAVPKRLQQLAVAQVLMPVVA